jgi:hypothetical protein
MDLLKGLSEIAGGNNRFHSLTAGRFSERLDLHRFRLGL